MLVSGSRIQWSGYALIYRSLRWAGSKKLLLIEPTLRERFANGIAKPEATWSDYRILGTTHQLVMKCSTFHHLNNF
jgi:hypothetical protein